VVRLNIRISHARSQRKVKCDSHLVTVLIRSASKKLYHVKIFFLFLNLYIKLRKFDEYLFSYLWATVLMERKPFLWDLFYMIFQGITSIRTASLPREVPAASPLRKLP
jgi:hypothetical protein